MKEFEVITMATGHEIVKEEHKFREERKLKYLLHLWDINRPFFNEDDCLVLTAYGAGYELSRARNLLIKNRRINKK